MILDTGIIVGRNPEEHRFAAAPCQHFLSPVGHKALVGFGYTLTRIIHHHRQLVATLRYFPKITFFPMRVAIWMPAGWRWVGSNREQLSLRQGRSQVFKEGEEIG